MGIIEALELRSMQAKEGIGLEFIFIICAVVGGCLLTGGYGSVIGTFFGACILGMVQLGIVDAQWDSNWTYTFQGAILFAAVLLNTVDPQPRAESPMSDATPHLLEVDGISQVLRQRRRAQGHHDLRERRRGDVHPRRQRRRQVDASSRSSPASTQPDEGRLLVDGEEVHFASPRDARAKRDRDRLPGSRDGAADVDLAELLPRRRADARASGRCSWFDAATREADRARASCTRWESTSATPTSRSARSRAASGSRSRSRAPSTSARGC